MNARGGDKKWRQEAEARGRDKRQRQTRQEKRQKQTTNEHIHCSTEQQRISTGSEGHEKDKTNQQKSSRTNLSGHWNDGVSRTS